MTPSLDYAPDGAKTVIIVQSPELAASVTDLVQRLQNWEATATQAGVPQDELSKADQELATSLSGSTSTALKYDHLVDHTGKVVRIINNAFSAADKLKDWIS